MGKTSNAVKRRWNKSHYEYIQVILKNGMKATIQAAAQAAGLSTNAFIMAAIMEKVNRGFVPPHWETMEPEVPHCGVCGRVLLDGRDSRFRFCPDCGAPVRWTSDAD